MRRISKNLLIALATCHPLRKIIPAIVAAALLSVHLSVRADGWEPSPGHTQVPIWPGMVPDALPNPKPESVSPPAGPEGWTRADDVSRPR